MHPKYTALFTSVNLLLGVGPLILPMPFYNAGLILSIIWMLFISIISYISAMFISQSLTRVHCMIVQPQQISTQKRFSFTDTLITSNQQDFDAEKANKHIQTQKKLIDHTDQFQILFSKSFNIIPCLCISIYLLGTSISKCIMTGKTMADVFDDYAILKQFDFWIIIFFISGASFSFRSIDQTKIMQIVIVSVRTISILLFIIGAIFLIIKHKQFKHQGPNFNASNFVQIFSNGVFSLMFHHSLPGIVHTLSNPNDIQFVIRNAFIISASVLILIPLTGLFAFGSYLTIDNKDNTVYPPDKLKYYNLDFQNQIPFIYYITSFYVFLNIAAFSVYIIVIRSNILRIITPVTDPKKFTKITAAASLAILGTIIGLSWILQSKIQTVLDVTGGILGIFILFFIPTIEVYKARKVVHLQGDTKKWKQLPIFIFFFGIIFLTFNIYRIVNSLVRPSH